MHLIQSHPGLWGHLGALSSSTISLTEHLRNSGFSKVVKSGIVDASPRPGLVNAVTVISDTIVPGFRDGMMMKVVVAGSVVAVTRLPPLTL